ncbi:MAG: peptide chain release factor N(5)-glutamine methyltransferase [Eubacterium sp.]|nr:peptide chain release factor N(5)-glutamine methyltransferase [Eubacterium sp.]
MAQAEEILDAAGITESRIDSWLLAESILGVCRRDLFLEPCKSVSKEQAQKYLDAVSVRAEHIPLQHITGRQQFMDFEFIVNEDVLIPRPETELLVEQVVSYIKDDEVKVLDMCTGSGCIAVSVDRMCVNADVTAADISKKALKVAGENNMRNKGGVTFVQSDMFENIHGTYDIIVSNPPYIPTSDIEVLMEEVREHEPHLALDGSADGLKFYREICRNADNYLNKNGKVFLEIGYDQGGTVPELLRENGFTNIQVLKDLSGNDRMVIAGKE